MENVYKTEESLMDLPPATDNNQLPKDPSTTRDKNFSLNDCFIDVAPGSSKYCNILLTNNEELNKNLQNFSTNEESSSIGSMESFVCRICQNSENPEKLVSPCLCKGTLTYVHINCLERWISMSHCTTCELCQFQYNTEQTLRYSLIQSLRIWYSRSMSRRALQEDCQMFSLLTLVAFGIVGTLLVAVQYYILQGHVSGFGRLWTKGWLIFFLFTTMVVYLINVYMIVKSQLMPWYRWWQSARDIRLILENHKPPPNRCEESRRQMPHRKHTHQYATASATNETICHQQNQMSLEKATEVNSHDDNHHYTECNNDTTTCQNITESSSPATTTLFLNSTASYSNDNSNNNINHKQLLWKKDHNNDDDMKKKLAMQPDGAINAKTLYATKTTGITSIVKGNKSPVARTIAVSIDMPLESPHFIFDCIAVV